jgi:hypothetical protein
VKVFFKNLLQVYVACLLVLLLVDSNRPIRAFGRATASLSTSPSDLYWLSLICFLVPLCFSLTIAVLHYVFVFSCTFNHKKSLSADMRIPGAFFIASGLLAFWCFTKELIGMSIFTQLILGIAYGVTFYKMGFIKNKWYSTFSYGFGIIFIGFSFFIFSIPAGVATYLAEQTIKFLK